MESLATTTLTNQNITTPLMAASYSSGQSRELLANVYMDELVGSGVYRACVTKQIGGIGTEYQSPTSAISVGSGACTILLSTTTIAVVADDLIRVYVQGLTSDSSANVKTEFFDATSASVVGYVNLSSSALGEIAASVATASGVWDYTTRTLSSSAIAASTFAASAITREEFSLTAASKVWDASVRALTDKVNYGVSASALTEVADSVLDGVIESPYTLRKLMRIISAVLAGKTSGGGTTTAKFRDVNDTTDRVTATLDSSGNRTAITISGS